ASGEPPPRGPRRPSPLPPGGLGAGGPRAGAPGLPARAPPPPRSCGRVAALPPVWLESRAPFENMRLRNTPAYAGDGLPRGGGQPVLLIPGFMAADRSLATLRDWLLRMGYHAEIPGLTFNVRYSEAVLNTIHLHLVDLYGWLGQKVTLVGHSRGGLLAKVAAHRPPEMVERVVALGAPLADPFDISPFTMACVRLAQVFNLVRFGQTGEVERPFLDDLAAPV